MGRLSHEPLEQPVSFAAILVLERGQQGQDGEHLVHDSRASLHMRRDEGRQLARLVLQTGALVLRRRKRPLEAQAGQGEQGGQEEQDQARADAPSPRVQHRSASPRR